MISTSLFTQIEHKGYRCESDMELWKFEIAFTAVLYKEIGNFVLQKL